MVKNKGLIFIFISTLLVLVYSAIFSPVMSDDSIRYVEWADQLIASGFNFSNVESQGHNYASQYATFISLIAIAKVVFGSYWMQAVLAINIISSVVVLFTILGLVKKYHYSFIVLAGLAFFSSYDIMMWSKFILSDAFYLLVSTLFFVISIKLYQLRIDRNLNVLKNKYFYWLSIILVFCLLTRPTAIPLAFYYFSLLLALLLLPTCHDLRKSLSYLSIFLVVSFVIVSTMLALVLIDPANWSYDSLGEVAKYYSDRFNEGSIVHDRPYTYIQIDGNFLNIIYLIFLRTFYFFAIYLDGYSLLHTWYNILWFLPIYILGIYAVLECFFKDSVLQKWEKVLVFWGSIFVFFIVAFTSVTLLDYDHRYRIPTLPILILLATIGLNAVSKRLGLQKSDYSYSSHDN